MTGATRKDYPRPAMDRSALVRAAPGRGDGYWAGAPSAALDDDGSILLAWRERDGHTGGDRNVVARSRDGVAVELIIALESARLGARWLERPALVRTAEGRWRLFVSCASADDPSW